MMGFFKKKTEHYPDFWNSYAQKFDASDKIDYENTTFVVFDTETTGFSYDNDRIISIGALKVTQNSILVHQSFETKLDQYYYHANNIEIHGITRTETENSTSELEALQLFLDYIGNAVLVAHHAAFDIKMMNYALKRYGMPKLKNWVLDTSYLYRKSLIQSPLIPKKDSYSLDEVAAKLDIELKDRHTALGDAYITALAFMMLKTKLAKKNNFKLRKLARLI